MMKERDNQESGTERVPEVKFETSSFVHTLVVGR